ncbi:hypothetical protein D3C71_1740920 [compost metagenome]
MPITVRLNGDTSCVAINQAAEFVDPMRRASFLEHPGCHKCFGPKILHIVNIRNALKKTHETCHKTYHNGWIIGINNV